MIKVKIENVVEPSTDATKENPSVLIDNTGAQAGMVLAPGKSIEYTLESADVLTVKENI